MKKALRASGLLCAVACLSLALSVTSARAWAKDESSETVRTSQMRLAELGYYVGRYDGMMGPVTENAVKDYQRTNGLEITGQLNDGTFNLLMHRGYMAYDDRFYGDHAYWADGYHRVAYGYAAVPHIVWDDRWASVHSQEIPTRFGRVDIAEDDHGSLRHYSVTLNGHPLIFANNQPGVLRVSKTLATRDEDHIVFTAYNSDNSCAYKNYLLTIHRDGSFTMPREIGNCSANYEVHTADNSLFISFPGNSSLDGLTTWDVWRYRDNSLVRL